MAPIFPSVISDFMKGGTDSVRVFKSGPGTQAFLASSMLSKDKSVIIVVPGAAEFKEMRALLTLFSSSGATGAQVPAWDREWLFFPPIIRVSLNPKGGVTAGLLCMV